MEGAPYFTAVNPTGWNFGGINHVYQNIIKLNEIISCL
jgi:hypothetical protein